MERRVLILLYLAGAVFSIRLLLAMSGLTGAVNSYLPDLTTPGYIWAVLIHSLYGVLLFCIVITTGTGFLNLLRRMLALSSDDIDILGFPVGLFICLGLSLLCCLGRAGELAAALAVAGAALDYGRRHWHRPLLSSRRAMFAILPAVMFGACLAFMWKPTTTASAIGTVGLGDVTIYTGWYNALKATQFPFFNLGVEGEFVSYFNHLHSFYALALDFLPDFDIYLFILTSLSTFYVLSVTYILHALAVYRSNSGYSALSAGIVASITVILVAAARYPSWILESPPAVFLAPVALCVMYATFRAHDQPLRLGFALALAVTGSAISKVVSLAVLGSYTGLRLLIVILRRAHPVQLVGLGIICCAIAVYIVYMLRNFGNLFLPEWFPGPESWHRFQKKGWGEFQQVVPMLLKDVGLVLVAAGTLKLRDWALTVAAVLAVSSNFLFSFLFTPTPTALLMLLAAYLILARSVSKSAISLIVTGSLLFIPHHIRHDPGEWQMTLLWILTLGTAVFLVLRTHAETAENRTGQASGRTGWQHLAAAFLVGSLSLAALAQGDFRLGKKRIEPVPAALYDIWINTRLRTPVNALVFTDQTGDDTGRLSGWNDYSLMAQRQFYLSSWSTSRLRYRHADRRKRIANNFTVIAGSRRPTELRLSRNYAGYYAVLSRDRTVPVTFHMEYHNSDYALYEIR